MRLVRGANGAMIPELGGMAVEAGKILAASGPTECGPRYYKRLARATWHEVGWEPRTRDEARQSAEHLRESANDRVHGLDYVSRKEVENPTDPHVGLIFMRDWLPSITPSLFNQEASVSDLLSFDACVEAATEVGMRLPHMRNTFNNRPLVRAERTARGFLVEKNVKHWFKVGWPELFVDASNAGRYEDWSPDDFGLRLRGRVLRVDVKTERRDGTFGQVVDRKTGADIYLLGAGDGPRFHMFGWCSPREFAADPVAEQSRPMTRLFVALNCEVAGIDYRVLRRRCGLES